MSTLTTIMSFKGDFSVNLQKTMSSEDCYASNCNVNISSNGTMADSKENSDPVKAVLMRIFQLSIASHRNFCR